MSLKKVILLCLGVMGIAGFAFAQQDTTYVPGEVLIKTTETLTTSKTDGGLLTTGVSWFDALSATYSITTLTPVFNTTNVRFQNYYKVVFDPSIDVETVVEDFKAQSGVELAEPNYIFRTWAMPNDVLFNKQWALTKIQAPQAWDINTGSSSVIVGIIDTGTDIGFHPADPTDITPHPDMADNLWTDASGNYGYNATDLLEPPYDGYGHGTHVAGIAAASCNNGEGICGLAGGWGAVPGVKIMTVKGLDDYGSGRTDWLANAVYWAADNGAKVINMSWGMWAVEPGPVVLKDALGFAHDECGCVLVASAGNDMRAVYPDNPPLYYKKPYPAFWDSCIAVGATTITDEKAYYSNYSLPILSWVDIAAPGGYPQPLPEDQIFSTLPTYSDFYLRTKYNLNTDYDYLSGTSMSAPYVAGLAGLILSKWPELTNLQVRERILGSVDNIIPPNPDLARTQIIGTGRINAYKALTLNEEPVLHYWDHYLLGGTTGSNSKTVVPGANSMVLTLRNVWKDALDNPVKLRTNDPNVVFIDSVSNYNPLLQYASKDNAGEPFTFTVVPACSIGHTITFQIVKGSRIEPAVDGWYVYEVTDSFKVTVGPPMHQGWPVYLSGPVESSPAGADLDGDGYPEVVAGSNSDTVYAIKRDGSFLWKYGTNGDVKSSPAIADLDGDGRFETVIGSDDGHLYVINWDGSLKWKYPNSGSIDSVSSSPAIEDLNNDGLYEIIFGDLGNKVYALNNKGALLWQSSLPGKVYSSPAVGDLNDDNMPDVVIGCKTGTGYDSWLYALNGLNGNVIWQKTWIGDRDNTSYKLTASPNFADIDRDGSLEVIVSLGISNSGYNINTIYAYKKDGTELGHCPISQSYSDYPSKSSTAISDINNDEYPDIIGCDNATVSAIDKDGNYIWSKTLSSSSITAWNTSSPVTGALVNDGQTEIFCSPYNPVTNKNENHILGNTSDDLFNGPFAAMNQGIKSTPLVTSLNGGDKTDLIVGCDDGNLYVWSFNTPYSKSLAEWPMFQHDNRRTGNYHTGRPLTSKSLDATAYNNSRKMVYDSQLKYHLAYTSANKVLYTSSYDPAMGWDLPSIIGDGQYPSIALDAEPQANIVWTNIDSLGAVQLCGLRLGETSPTVIKELGHIGFDNNISCSPPSIAIKSDTVYLVSLQFHSIGIPPAVQCSKTVVFAKWPIGKYNEYQEEVVDYWEWTPSTSGGGGGTRSPSICINNKGYINLAWEKTYSEEPGDIWWTMRYAGGIWHGKENLSQSDGIPSVEPSLYTYGNVHLTWEENGEIFYRECVYQPTPLTEASLIPPQPWDPYVWSTPVNVSQTEVAASLQPVFVDNYITFMEQVGDDYEVMLYSKQNGVWQPFDGGNISQSPLNNSYYPQLCSYDGIFLHGIWTEGNDWGLGLKHFQKEGDQTALYQANLGDSLPSPYTVQRDGYIAYGSEAKAKTSVVTVDYDTTELIYQVTGLNTNKKHTLDINLYQVNSKAEKWQYTVLVDDIPIQTLWVASATPTRVIKLVPDAATKDGVLKIRIVKKKGDIVTCDWWQLFEEKKGHGGAQSAEALPINGFVNALYQNAPNPCNRGTVINYQLAKTGQVSIKVYNTLGQVVKTILNASQEPGYHAVKWDGRDGGGRQVTSGIYFYRLASNEFNSTKKMVVLR